MPDGRERTLPGGISDRVVFFGHATVLIELNGVRLLTDPVIRGRVAHLRRRAAPVDMSAIGAPDAVLISHLHHDHLDLASLRRLGRMTPVIAPAGAGAWLRRRGIVSVTDLNAGESLELDRVSVSAVEARHDGRRVLARVRVPSLGFVVRGDRNVYFAGDTELFGGMARLAGRIDVALLPVAGWGPTLGAGHMDPLEAARAAELIQPRVAIPIHWGTLTPIGSGADLRARLAEAPQEFARHVARIAPDVEVRVLAPGEGTIL